MESLEVKKDLFRRLDDIVRPDAILATNTSSLPVTEIATANTRPGRVVGVHFFNPAPVQNLVEIVRTVVTEPAVLADVEGAGGHARQEPGRLRRQGRLHRQHAAVRLPQPRGVDVREQVRHPRGHRRGHALRLRLPDGPAGAARPDRPRHGVRDPRHDVQAGPRPAARPGADPQADGHRRPAGPQVRPRLLHLRARRQPDRRGRRPDPVGRRPAPAQARHPHRRRRRHRHHGRRHRRGLRQERLRRPVRRPLATTRSRACAPRSSSRFDKAIQRGKLRGAEGRGARPADRHHVAGRPGRRRHRGRGDRRGPARSRPRSSRTSTRSASPARSWPPPPPSCRSSRWPR